MYLVVNNLEHVWVDLYICEGYVTGFSLGKLHSTYS